jgi:hypothetical protein
LVHDQLFNFVLEYIVFIYDQLILNQLVMVHDQLSNISDHFVVLIHHYSFNDQLVILPSLDHEHILLKRLRAQVRGLD